MARHYMSPEVVCPFYRGEESSAIFCEGPTKEVTLSLYFKKGIGSYKECRCRYEWTQCPIARMIWSQYDDIDNIRDMAAFRNRSGLGGLAAHDHHQWENENRP